MHSFIFGEPPLHCVTSKEVATGITDTETLFTTLADALSFPDYFGMNWDALDECIRDLSWLPAGHVNLIHHDMPLLDNKEELHTYLSILDSAVKGWEATGSNLIFLSPELIDPSVDKLVAHRKFFIRFPEKFKDVINSTLKRNVAWSLGTWFEKRRVSAGWKKQCKANMKRMAENEKMNHMRIQMAEAWAKRDYSAIVDISSHISKEILSQPELLKIDFAQKRFFKK